MTNSVQMWSPLVTGLTGLATPHQLRLQVKRCYKCHKNTCKIDPFLKNCKKIRNQTIGLKFFPLESENSLLHVKKITTLPTVSFLFYRLKMKTFCLQSRLQANEEKKLQNEPAKVQKMFEKEVLNNILTHPPTLPHLELFL